MSQKERAIPEFGSAFLRHPVEWSETSLMKTRPISRTAIGSPHRIGRILGGHHALFSDRLFQPMLYLENGFQQRLGSLSFSLVRVRFERDRISLTRILEGVQSANAGVTGSTGRLVVTVVAAVELFLLSVPEHVSVGVRLPEFLRET